VQEKRENDWKYEKNLSFVAYVTSTFRGVRSADQWRNRSECYTSSRHFYKSCFTVSKIRVGKNPDFKEKTQPSGFFWVFWFFGFFLPRREGF
jgi:hypothetical protein